MNYNICQVEKNRSAYETEYQQRDRRKFGRKNGTKKICRKKTDKYFFLLNFVKDLTFLPIFSWELFICTIITMWLPVSAFEAVISDFYDTNCLFHKNYPIIPI